MALFEIAHYKVSTRLGFSGNEDVSRDLVLYGVELAEAATLICSGCVIGH